MFTLNPVNRKPFDRANVTGIPRSPGVYVIYDLAGPIYAGRSQVDIHRRLQNHLEGRGNRIIARARQLGAASSLTFTYCMLPKAEQADAERILIASLGVAKFANLRHEGLYEDDLQQNA